jgi:hypothetical protein
MKADKAAATTAGCGRCLQLVVRNREVELLRMRESELQLEVQQLVARNRELESLRQQRNRELELQQLEVQQLATRNRELELQLKVHKLAQATLRAAEAEGARWCAPRLSVYECRRCSLHVPDPRAPLCAHALFVRLFAVCVGQPGHERGATIGLADGPTDRSVRCGTAIRASTWDMRNKVLVRREVEDFDVAHRGDRHATGLQRSVKVRVRNRHDLALAASGLGVDRTYTQQQ